MGTNIVPTLGNSSFVHTTSWSFLSVSDWEKDAHSNCFPFSFEYAMNILGVQANSKVAKKRLETNAIQCRLK